MDKENKRNRIYRWLNNKQYIKNHSEFDTKQYNNIQIKEKKVILNTTEKKNRRRIKVSNEENEKKEFERKI